ncbi:hypothetical protein ACFT2C_03660 [Promicromonospora sp. NPDC057138]|uniref:hypothetical protein n=1 Tax=Promicromonospora sp. NPDC057138 TaxID=3346031 RepID=UPI00363FD1DD
MTDRGPCSRVELDGRRVVIDLSDADHARLTAIAVWRGLDGPQLVLGWIHRGILSNHIQAASTDLPDRAARLARDVEVARQSDELFGDLLSENDRD